MKLPLATLVAMLLALGAGACGGSDAEPGSNACLVGAADCADDPGSGMCPPDVTDCVDTSADDFDVEAARARAYGLLGLYRSDVPEAVRIARIGDDELPITDDHRLGRMTVEIEDTDGSGLRVVAVVVELPDGAETYELAPT